MDKLITTKELAERWQVSERTINEYKLQGIISPVEGLPCIRYNPLDIAAIEGTKLESFSPLEKRRLERELQAVSKERDELKNILASILAESSKVINIINK